jgi:hypothetical protein
MKHREEEARLLEAIKAKNAEETRFGDPSECPLEAEVGGSNPSASAE